MNAKRIVDPEKYAAMSKPFPSKLQFDAAVAEFSKGVRALREKYKITDVYVVISASAMVDKTVQEDENTHADVEEPETFISTMHCGASEKCLPLVAAAFGFEKAKHDELIEGLVNNTRVREREKGD